MDYLGFTAMAVVGYVFYLIGHKKGKLVGRKEILSENIIRTDAEINRTRSENQTIEASFIPIP